MHAFTRFVRAGLFAPQKRASTKQVGSVMTLRVHNYATKSFEVFLTNNSLTIIEITFFKKKKKQIQNICNNIY